MINSKKKGFTIVELVIVVAVVAILAAVLIPTFSSLVKKANISADQQAVVHMNKLLAMDEVADPKPTKADEVVEVLIKNGYSDDLTTYYSNYQLAWLPEENVVVLVENGSVVYPDKYVGETGFEELKPMVKDVEELLESLQNGETVFVSEDILAEDAADFTFASGTYALNLNGNTMSTNVTDGNYGVKIKENSNSVIENGIIEAGDKIRIAVGVWDDSTLELKNMIITGGTTIGEKSGVGAYVYSGSTLVITDSKIYGGNGANTVQNYGGNLTLNNVTIVQSGEALVSWYNSAVQIINVIVYQEDLGKWKITSQANTTINGGSYTGDKAIQISAPGGNVTINDGKFTGATYALQNDFAPQNYIDGDKYESIITINGGTFDGDIKISAATVLIINGGTFTINPSTIQTGNVTINGTVVDNGNGTWTVK